MGHSRREPLAVDWAMRLSKRPRARMTRGGFRERGGEASSSRRMTRKIAGRDLPARNHILQGSARRITPRRLEGGPKRWLANTAGADATQGEREQRQEREGSGKGHCGRESGNRVTEDKLEKPEETKRQNSRGEPDNSASSTRQGEATAAQDLEKLPINDEGKRGTQLQRTNL